MGTMRNTTASEDSQAVASISWLLYCAKLSYPSLRQTRTAQQPNKLAISAEISENPSESHTRNTAQCTNTPLHAVLRPFQRLYRPLLTLRQRRRRATRCSGP